MQTNIRNGVNIALCYNCDVTKIIYELWFLSHNISLVVEPADIKRIKKWILAIYVLFIKASIQADHNKTSFHTFSSLSQCLAMQIFLVAFDRLLRYALLRLNDIKKLNNFHHQMKTVPTEKMGTD